MRPPPTDPVIHLELHSANPRAAVAFYSELCRWRSETIGAGSCSYLSLEMGDRVGGGVVQCPAGHSLWLPYVKVGDVGQTTERASELGGKVLLQPREGPQGWRSVIAAPDGGEVAFFQPK